MSRNHLVAGIFIALGVFLAIRFFHRRNREDSQIRENMREVEQHQREIDLANEGTGNAIPAFATFGELPLVAAIVTPFATALGWQTKDAEFMPSIGGYDDMPIPRTSHTESFPATN